MRGFHFLFVFVFLFYALNLLKKSRGWLLFVLLGPLPVDRAVGVLSTTPIPSGVSAPTPVPEDDIKSLQTIKRTVKDPHNYLYTWNFNNKRRGLSVTS